MTQAEIDRAVSRATGESVAIFRSMGFSAVEPIADGPHIIDCDGMDQERLRTVTDSQRPKRQKKQLRLVVSALASLKQLQAG